MPTFCSLVILDHTTMLGKTRPTLPLIGSILPVEKCTCATLIYNKNKRFCQKFARMSTMQINCQKSLLYLATTIVTE